MIPARTQYSPPEYPQRRARDRTDWFWFRSPGDGLAAQFGAKLLFDRGEIGVEIDKQPIDRSIDHFLPHQPCILFLCQQEIDIAASSYDGVFDGLLRSEVAESVAAANHLDHVVGTCEGTRGSGLSAEVLFHESAMPSLSKNEGHIDAAQFRSRCALGCARIAGSLATRLPEQSVKIAPAKAADLSCPPHPGCRTALAAHA
jgi:hypothetical protein